MDLAYLLRDSSEETSSVYSLAGCETQSLQRQAVRRPEQNGTGVWSHVAPRHRGPNEFPSAPRQHPSPTATQTSIFQLLGERYEHISLDRICARLSTC